MEGSTRSILGMTAAVTAAVMILLSTCTAGSASYLAVNAEGLKSEAFNVPMCDTSVTIQRNGLIFLSSVTVSNISSACIGHTLKVTVVTLGLLQYERSAVVTGSTMVIPFGDLNLNLLSLLGSTYFAFDPP